MTLIHGFMYCNIQEGVQSSLRVETLCHEWNCVVCSQSAFIIHIQILLMYVFQYKHFINSQTEAHPATKIKHTTFMGYYPWPSSSCSINLVIIKTIARISFGGEGSEGWYKNHGQIRCRSSSGFVCHAILEILHSV